MDGYWLRDDLCFVYTKLFYGIRLITISNSEPIFSVLHCEKKSIKSQPKGPWLSLWVMHVDKNRKKATQSRSKTGDKNEEKEQRIRNWTKCLLCEVKALFLPSVVWAWIWYNNFCCLCFYVTDIFDILWFTLSDLVNVKNVIWMSFKRHFPSSRACLRKQKLSPNNWFWYSFSRGIHWWMFQNRSRFWENPPFRKKNWFVFDRNF